MKCDELYFVSKHLTTTTKKQKHLLILSALLRAENHIGLLETLLLVGEESDRVERRVDGAHLVHGLELLDLLDALLGLLLARALAVEAMREVAEGLLGIHGVALLVVVVELEVGLVAGLLLEVVERPAESVALPVVLVVDVVVGLLLDGDVRRLDLGSLAAAFAARASDECGAGRRRRRFLLLLLDEEALAHGQLEAGGEASVDRRLVLHNAALGHRLRRRRRRRRHRS